MIGLAAPDKTRNAILKDLKDNLSPITAYSVTLETLEGKCCLVIDVPAGSELPYLYDGRIYFFLRGLVERFGTGTQRIVSACREWGARLSIFLVVPDLV